MNNTTNYAEVLVDMAHANPDAFYAISAIIDAHRRGEVIAVDVWVAQDVRNWFVDEDIEDYTEEDVERIVKMLKHDHRFSGSWSPDDFDTLIDMEWENIKLGRKVEEL